MKVTCETNGHVSAMLHNTAEIPSVSLSAPEHIE